MISQDQYRKFLEAVTNDIEGDWVLVGGALMAVLIPNSRATADIDLCPIGELTNERRISLMRLAQKSHLSIEAINPSADFFLRQIPQWQASLILFIKGAKGNLYRPSLELYIKMKTERATESDISDCIAFWQWHKDNGLDYDSVSIRDYLNQKISQENQPQKKLNLQRLLSVKDHA